MRYLYPRRMIHSITRGTSRLLLKAIELRQRADEQAIPRQGRGGHAHFIQRILVQQTVLGTVLKNERVPVLAQGEDLAIRPPRRGRERGGLGADALLFVNLPAGPRVVAGQKSEIEQD